MSEALVQVQQQTQQTTTAQQTQQQQAPDWRATLPDDLKAHASLANYKSHEEEIRAHLNLEKRLGHQEDFIQKPKSWDDEKERTRIFDALGRPQAADKYDLAPIAKEIEAAGMEPEFKNKLLTVLHASGANDFQARAVIKGLLSVTKESADAHTKALADHKTESEGKLRTEFGKDFPEKIALANRAATYLFDGDTAKMLTEMNLLNDAGFIKGLVKLGGVMAEGKIDLGGSPGFSATPQAAKAKLDAHFKDTKWMLAWRDGRDPAHDIVQKEYLDLMRQITEGEKKP